MNEHSLNDPRLKSLEARLLSLTPQLPAAEQKQLLYDCGYAAGRKSTRRSLRSWQAIAAMLAVFMVGGRLSPESKPELITEQRARQSDREEMVIPQIFAQPEIAVAPREAGEVQLDAWKAPPSGRAALGDELAQFQESDPHLKSLTMGVFTRNLLKQ